MLVARLVVSTMVASERDGESPTATPAATARLKTDHKMESFMVSVELELPYGMEGGRRSEENERRRECGRWREQETKC